MRSRRQTDVLRRLWSTYLQPVLLIAIALIFLLPVLWGTLASFRRPGLPPPHALEWLPQRPTLANYERIFTLAPLDRYILNSLLITLVAVPLTLVTASWAGLAMSQLALRARRRLMLLALLLLMVPMSALWLPRFVIFKYLLLLDTPLALIAPALMGTSPLFVLLFYWTFRRLPAELFDTARLDGAGVLRTWASIALPLARPTALTVGVLSFVSYWSDFINPLLYLKSERFYTLPVGLQILQQMDRSNWPLLMAASVVLMLPVVLLFGLIQRYFWAERRLSGIR